VDHTEKSLKEAFGRNRSMTVRPRGGRLEIEHHRKSRFVMKDARWLLQKLEQAGVSPDSGPVFFCRTPICGKSLAYLQKAGLPVRIPSG